MTRLPSRRAARWVPLAATVVLATAPTGVPPGAATAAPLPAGAPAPALVVTRSAVHPVDEGGTARVDLSVVTPGAAVLAEPVTVTYATEGGSAEPGRDYTPVRGSLVLPAGTPSGAGRSVRVTALRDGAAEEAETVALRLTVRGARGPAETPLVVVNAHGLPYLDPSLPTRERVADLLGRMSLREKAGQMTQAERGALRAPGDIAGYGLGSVLSGGGSAPTPNTPAAWARMTDAYQLRTRATRLQIPLLYGVDAVHGHNNVAGATIMPHNIGIGAGRDPGLAERTAAVTAKEVRATGVPWSFAPCLCVSRDERWGRSYESFGEDPALVTAMAAVIGGMQGAPDGTDLDRGDKVLTSAKHFVGDGGTAYGSSSTGSYTVDQGITRVTRAELEAVHLAPFAEAVRRGAGTVMPSYSSLDVLGDGRGPVKMHAHTEMITGVLKGRMGFEGFVVSDWQAIDQLPGDYASDVRTSVTAGLDMIMVPTEYPEFVRVLVAEVEAGRVPMARVDDAVGRILTQKFRLGLFEKPYADTTHLSAVGSAAHRAVAREAVARSQVLLRNEGAVLPLRPGQRVYVAGSNADDLGRQSGDWTLSWQGAPGRTTTGTTILEAMRRAAPGADIAYSADASAPVGGYDVGVVVIGEAPYAEGVGDVGNGHVLEPAAADRAAIDRVCGAVPCAVLVVSGRPQLLGDRLPVIDALVASWLPGTEGDGVADVLYGRRPFTGRLPVSWPASESQLPLNVGDARYAPLFPYGWGLTTLAPPPAGGAPALRAVERTVHALRAAGRAHTPEARRLVDRARLIVQDRIGPRVAEPMAKPFAEADHLLMSGDPVGAVTKLREAYAAAET